MVTDQETLGEKQLTPAVIALGHTKRKYSTTKGGTIVCPQ
jgi:hypothetical protein